MKRAILVFTVTGVLAFTNSVVLAQENAAEVSKELQQDLKLAKIDSAADYQKFTKAAELEISFNQKTIVDLKARKDDPNKDVSIAFDQKVLELEQDNNDLKKRIVQSDQVKTYSWTLFKNDFNRDMRELDKALRDI